MTLTEAAQKLGVDHQISDEEVVKRVLAGEVELYEIIMRRYNSRLYRTVLAIMGNDGEVEQVMQDAYVAAYTHLQQFAHKAKFSTWLTRIAVHEALARKRNQNRFVDIDSFTEPEKEYSTMLASRERDPEQQALDHEMRSILEQCFDRLPEHYRAVCMLRDVEGLDTAETAECLSITEEAVKTRLHRARSLLREDISAHSDAALPGIFEFHLSRCDRIVAGVMQRIQGSPR